jgi:hypothetical protein
VRIDDLMPTCEGEKEEKNHLHANNGNGATAEDYIIAVNNKRSSD